MLVPVMIFSDLGNDANERICVFHAGCSSNHQPVKCTYILINVKAGKHAFAPRISTAPEAFSFLCNSLSDIRLMYGDIVVFYIF